VPLPLLHRTVFKFLVDAWISLKKTRTDRFRKAQFFTARQQSAHEEIIVICWQQIMPVPTPRSSETASHRLPSFWIPDRGNASA
jgi:hypothetical protein